ncbi:MAG: EI24 domain-containing protein [Propionivibrio sp.]|uniref:EI24 domain-containing protein n=1 Tax=Propionivibrio sp. TaxID=2212460 RepID=UPI001A63350D|nr:EI24 domain-containing protein [Propionivibrio sp.]MBL8413511.1 EI24 domain-containing protein [Propionivibrio sp.]
MGEVILALKRSLVTLGRGRVWLYILGPAILALIVMIALSLFLLERLIALFVTQPPMNWITDWGALWLAKLLAALGGWLLILSASYLVAMVLTAIVVLPLLLDHLAASDYPELARMGKDSVAAATWNSLWAALLFIVGWLVTLPLWLVPGLGLILPFFWMAWLNRRTFAYDSLAVHASDREWHELRRQLAMPLLALGFVMALLTHIPFMGLLAPSLAALAYVHFCLEALRRLRRGAIVTLIEKPEVQA